MDVGAPFKGKKITLMGLGVLGRGVGDARFLAQSGAELIVTDLKSEAELASSLVELKPFKNISYTLGAHKLEDFRNRDLIIKSAGVPLDSSYIAEAQKNKIPVRMSADLFLEHAGVEAIGITGTRGKSTVTHMIAAILETAGKKVLLGGNVRGVSNLQLLTQVTPSAIAVLELDSWQLQGFGTARMSPHIAVFTTFYPDHLNYYKNDLDAYLADKANIFLHQTSADTLVLGSQCADLVKKKYEENIASTIVVSEPLPNDWTLAIAGEHNRYDAALALATVRAAGVDDAVSRKALAHFKGVPGRLELVGEVNGVKFYNDTTATTPEATLAALKALQSDEPHTILIMGGADKALNMRPLLEEIPIYTKTVVLLAGNGTSLIAPTLADAPIYNSLAEALAEARHRAAPGDSVLFSPAFASFGMFKNEYDRGDQFNAIVQAYA